MRRRLSSLRGAWRWSTGHLFRKVGRDGGDGRGSRSFKLLVCFFFLFVVELFLSSPSRTFTSPQRLSPSLPPSLRSLLRSLALSQMVNLNGLLVKSTSTDGFHLETGPLDPPLQFPPPTSSSSSFASPLFFPTQERKQVLGVDGVMFRNYVVRLQHNHLVFLLLTSDLVVFQAPFTEPLRDVSHFSRRQKRRRDRRESPRLITGPHGCASA